MRILTILFGDVLSRSYEVRKALELLTSHSSITSALEGQVLLEMGIQVLFEGQIADKSHTADAAVELDP